MNIPLRSFIPFALTATLLILFILLILAVVLILPSPSSSADDAGGDVPHALLEPALARVLNDAPADTRIHIIVEMRERVSPASVVGAHAAQADDRLATRAALVEALQATADRAQADVRAYLATERRRGHLTAVRPFWIFDGLAVYGARPDVIRALAARPDVALIRLDHRRRWIETPPEPLFRTSGGPLWSASARISARTTTTTTQVAWGVERIHADRVWASLGISGTGVVVANIDTGVDWTHPALQTNYRGYDPKGFHQHAGNWFDATGAGALYPVDSYGHGTHTMGTLAGRGGIGVAPDARWIAARAFDYSGSAMDSWLHAAFEWVLAPAGDPALAPDVVNNSWGNDISGLTTFQADLDALRAAGILAVFSAGNNGPTRGSVGSPASLPGAFAVGASDEDDEVAYFSARGPSPWGEVRPHVVAPGVHVNSALPGGAYANMNGTSMAAPHVAGTAALMLSAHPGLDITQTISVLTRTAVPITLPVPNNDSGYGRIDAYAAVALAADAGQIAGVVRGDGLPIAAATVAATPMMSGTHGTATTDADGQYHLFLRAGDYDLTAHAFGYAPVSVHHIVVTTGSTTTQHFDLPALPTGRVYGTVVGEGGEPVEATVAALSTPVAGVATGGAYTLDLPAGEYTLEARALGYRVVTASVTVTAGQARQVDFVLPESIRLLLVDSGAWYYDSQVHYYRQALDANAYAYDEVHIKHPPDDSPVITDLLDYDLVIWSAPRDSPGYVQADDAVSSYLESGGNLLLSGQDVAYWDTNVIFAPYYGRFFHASLKQDNAPSREVICAPGTPFEGLHLTIEGGDGADNQNYPDELWVSDTDHATSACKYSGGKSAVAQAGFCEAHRALGLGFGFEAIAGAAERADFMTRALDWFASPRQTVGIEVLPQTETTLVTAPGGVVTHTFRLRNTGEAGTTDTLHIELADVAWETTLLTPTVELTPCAVALVSVRVTAPASATWNQFDALTVTVRSTVSPTLSETLGITTKVNAPVLLVDDDRWYNQERRYMEALNAADIPFDSWEVEEVFGAGSPPADILRRYPVVLWFNGYDWYDPIHPNELERLTGYLDAGGRLFLSSQEYLYFITPQESLTRDYFGVAEHSEVLSQTTVSGVPGNALGDGIGPVTLDYPFRNFSDSVMPVPGAAVAFRGQHGQPGAVTHAGVCVAGDPACRWRTAFFAFPVEAFPLAERTTVMERVVGRLNWLGSSELLADRAVAQISDTVGYTLTIRNDGPGEVVGAQVGNTLPTGAELVAGPTGGAGYDTITRRVHWSGDLTPGEVHTFTYRLRLTGGTAFLPLRNRATYTVGQQGLHFEREAGVRIAAPDLSHSSLTVTPTTVNAAAAVTVTLIVRNDGLADAPQVHVDVPLPWRMRLLTGTVSVVGGGTVTLWPDADRLQWEGPVAVGAPVTLRYRAVASTAPEAPTWAYVAARLDDGLGGAWERGGWVYVRPCRAYLPVVVKCYGCSFIGSGP